MNSFARISFLPRNYDLALLILRVSFGLLLFRLHGLSKLTNYGQMAAHFPDPLHIGSQVSLLFAILSDAICSLLVVLGLATRWAALIIAINTGVAFVLVHKMTLLGPHSGEVALLFFFWAVTLFLAGGGQYSLNRG